MDQQGNSNYNPYNHYEQPDENQQRRPKPYQQHQPYDRPGNAYQGAAIASLITGIFSIVFCFQISFSLMLGAAGIATGAIYMSKRQDKRGLAIAGIITSIIGMLLAIAFLVLLLFAFNRHIPY